MVPRSRQESTGEHETYGGFLISPLYDQGASRLGSVDMAVKPKQTLLTTAMMEKQYECS